MIGCDKQGSLLVKTRYLLERDKRGLLDIHKETDIPFYWLKKFSSGGFDNPSVNRVQFLYEFLTGAKLQLK